MHAMLIFSGMTIFGLVVQQVTGGRFTSADHKEFFLNLTRNHDPEIRPVPSTSVKTDVAFSVGLYSILLLDEKEEILTSCIWFRLLWKDHFLTWNATSAASPDTLMLDASDIWTPRFYLMNSIRGMVVLKAEDSAAVRLESSGTASYYLARTYATRCKIDIRLFPFDSQVCRYYIAPYNSTLSGEWPVLTHLSVERDLYEENGEWNFRHSTVQLGTLSAFGFRYVQIEVSLTLTRRSTFYVVNTILPVVFLSILNSFSCLLPEESGEKISFCVSILLSYALFLNLVSTYLPENSDEICYFSVYLILLVFVSALTCVVILFSLAVHTRLRKGKKIPRWLASSMKEGSAKSASTMNLQGGLQTKEFEKCVSKFNWVAFVTFLTLTIMINILFALSVTMDW